MSPERLITEGPVRPTPLRTGLAAPSASALRIVCLKPGPRRSGSMAEQGVPA